MEKMIYAGLDSRPDVPGTEPGATNRHRPGPKYR